MESGECDMSRFYSMIKQIVWASLPFLFFLWAITEFVPSGIEVTPVEQGSWQVIT